jgi:phosphoribosylamine--glycine ligase
LGELKWNQDATVGVVVASETYPTGTSPSVPISGLSDVEDGVLVFHAGTDLRGMFSLRTDVSPREKSRGFLSSMFRSPEPAASSLFDAQLYTSGGRVLTVVARGATLAEARERVYRNVGRVRFSGAQFRRDIAVGEASSQPGE